jgi:hypothetical protein
MELETVTAAVDGLLWSIESHDDQRSVARIYEAASELSSVVDNLVDELEKHREVGGLPAGITQAQIDRMAARLGWPAWRVAEAFSLALDTLLDIGG